MSRAALRSGAAASLLLLSVVGCSSGPPGGSELNACVAPTESELTAAATLQGMVGDFRLEVMTPRGAEISEEVTADLILTAHTPEMQRVQALDGTVRSDASAPLYGWTDLDLDALGALSMGGLDSRDPEAPGVGVYETRYDGPPSIILRLGSEANRREGNAIDGGTTVLRVLRIGDGYFSGSWRSAVGAQERASGFFCAVQDEG